MAGGSGEGGGDAQAPGGKSPLAGGKCDWQAPFGTPQRVPAPFNSTTGGQQYSTNDSFWLSDDGLRAYFSARSGTSLNSYDIFWSQRDSTLSAFPSPLPLALSSPTRERQISLNASELLLAYQNDDEILLSARKSQNEDFAPGVALPSPVNIPILHVRSGEAFLTRDGRQLYFTSNRAGTNDLHVVQLDGVTPVGDAEPLVELNTTMYEGAPLLSDDELTIYYQSGVMAQVWSAHRRDLSSSFEDPHPVLELGSDAEEWPEALSADGCHIYTCRWHRDLDYTLYESFRSPTWTKP